MSLELLPSPHYHALPIKRPAIQHAFYPLPQYCLAPSLYVAQQSYRALTLKSGAHSAPLRTVLLLTFLADNRDPTTGTGDRLYHYSHSRSLTECDRGPLLSIHQGGRQDHLHRSLPRGLLEGLPLTTT
jgi:hypothetical protein